MHLHICILQIWDGLTIETIGKFDQPDKKNRITVNNILHQMRNVQYITKPDGV
jgi:hypothetical protein